MPSIDAIQARMGIDTARGLRVFGPEADDWAPDPRVVNLYLGMDSASQVERLRKALLARCSPGDRLTVLCGEELAEVRLADLTAPMTAVAVQPTAGAWTGHEFDGLVALMARLRGPEGCPWDREQTPESLRPAVIEEAYEVVDAIDSHAPERLRDELGDLLLLILFQAELAREQGAFAIDGVLRGLRDKLIRRHAHVFGEVVAEDAAAVIASWERIKRGEVGQSPSALRDLPAGLPALMRAQTLQKRAAQVGFDWPDLAGPLAKVREETDEVTQAVEAGTPLAIEHEIGDVLFAVVNLARHLQVDAEECLRQACGRFTERFHWVEAAAAAGGRELTRMTLPEMDALWEEAKRNLSQTGVDEEET